MLSIDDLNDYNKWLETTPADVLFSATGLGGWSQVFPSQVPVWASKVRNYFNVLPTTLRRLENQAAQAMLGAKTGPRMTFLANCHQDQTFNRYHRGKPTPLGPAPDPFKVHAACPARASKETMHMDDFIPTRDALSNDVYLDDHGWLWYQMSAGATIYHWGGEVRWPSGEAAYTQVVTRQKGVPVFKLVSMDGSGGSREVILLNYGAGSAGGGGDNIGKVNAHENIYKRIIRDPIKQGSYNYSEATQVGFSDHERRDVKTHRHETDFYVNPADMHSDLKLRKFPKNDKKGNLLATQVKWN
jgi:hypothetical protein